MPDAHNDATLGRPVDEESWEAAMAMHRHMEAEEDERHLIRWAKPRLSGPAKKKNS